MILPVPDLVNFAKKHGSTAEPLLITKRSFEIHISEKRLLDGPYLWPHGGRYHPKSDVGKIGYGLLRSGQIVWAYLDPVYEAVARGLRKKISATDWRNLLDLSDKMCKVAIYAQTDPADPPDEYGLPPASIILVNDKI